MNIKLQWGLFLTLLAVPYVVLGVCGMALLYEHGWWLWWFLGTLTLTGLACPIFLRLRRRRVKPRSDGHAEPSPLWTKTGQLAWSKVEALAARPELRDFPVDQPEEFTKLLREVFETVAHTFNPSSKKPLLETPIPHVLRVCELVMRDLRIAFSTHVPGAHILTIHDLHRVQKWASWGPVAYRLYRIGRAVLNPAAAVAGEVNTWMQGKLFNASVEDIKRWALEYAVKQAGFYAIQLYSGQLALADIEEAGFMTAATREDVAEASVRGGLRGEPLRVLVLGQVKSGKSSLINAIFGETRAATDVIPRTAGVEPYLLEKEGISQALILDTAGYQDPARHKAALAAIREEVLQCDLVLMTVSALTAARDADRQLLDDVRGLFQSDPHNEFPPLLVAVTHVDQLRPFREWFPPYDITDPKTPKAENIRLAVDTVATDLAIAAAQVVPVCLQAGRLYNVEEAFIPAILGVLNDAQRVKCLRCLREYHDEQYWSQLREQALNAGRLLWQVATGRMEVR